MEEEINSTARIDVPMSFRVTNEERSKIIQNAKERNLSVSNYLRSIALGQANLDQPETYEENELRLENQQLIEENVLLKQQLSNDSIIIPCSLRQRELLEEIYHPTVFSDENILPSGFDELSLENNLLIALFILPNLIELTLNSKGDICQNPFIGSNYDFKDCYPVLKLGHEEFGKTIFETISEVSFNEEKRTSEIINQNKELKKNLAEAIRLVKEVMGRIQQ
jgi:uncharacterized membrane protein